MVNKLKQLNKQNIIKYLIIVAITILFCQNFLQMHYSSDTYVLYDLGYMEYPSQYFLLDGRLISTVVCYLAGILNVPIPAYIIGMDFIGIILIATAIYMMDRILEKIIKPQKNIVKLMLLASCFILILNQFTLEYLLFPESAVMCLGVLFNVIAVKLMIDNPKHKYIKIFLSLLVAVFCYQGLLNMFPVLAILVYIVKQIVDKREYKIKEKEFFIEMIKLAIIVIVVLAICMIAIKVGKTLLNSNQDRMMHLVDMEAVMLRGETVLEYLDELWNKTMHMLPDQINNIILIISFISLILLKTKKEIIMQYVLLLIVSFTICIVPMFLFNTGICGRVNEPLTMIWGVSLIILLAQSMNISEGKRTNFIYCLVIISFIINNIFIMQNITEHIASNRVEENMGKTIKYALEEYEQKTGNKVTKFAYAYDRNPQQYAVGIKPIGSLTERKLACSWSISQAINFYCERKFEKVRMPTQIYAEKMIDKDYKEFSEEQLVFEGDTLYMLVY
ncbi:MAG: glucosyltransferase domain-containing protein [Clostridia bacterium]